MSDLLIAVAVQIVLLGQLQELLIRAKPEFFVLI
jgi:hypothetical protein